MVSLSPVGEQQKTLVAMYAQPKHVYILSLVGHCLVVATIGSLVIWEDPNGCFDACFLVRKSNHYSLECVFVNKLPLAHKVKKLKGR